MNDRVTCQILNYNDYKTTIKLIDNIVNYSIIDYVLVIDNESENNSLFIIESRYKTNDKVKVVSSGKNGGYGYGNNFGVNYAVQKLKSKYIIISNPDVAFDESLVYKMIKIMKAKDAALVSGTQRINGIPVKRRAWRVPKPLEWATMEIGFQPKFYYPDDYYITKISKVECVLGAMFMIDAQKFIKVSGYDEDMFLFCEETTLGFKFKEKGYSSYIINDKFYDHLHSATIGKSIPSVVKRLKILYASEIIFDKKYQKMTLLEGFIVKSIFNLSILKNKVKKYLKKE